MSSALTTWVCPKCTFINNGETDGEEPSSISCIVCQEPRENASFVLPRSGNASANATDSTREQKNNNRRNPRNTERNLSSSINSIKNISSSFCSQTHSRSGSLIAGNDSISALGNMSFAAWESDRKHWTCKACTFVNQPRYLICSACGLAEGGSCGSIFMTGNDGGLDDSDDELTNELGHMSITTAQAMLMEKVNKNLHFEREDLLRKERIVELLDDQESQIQNTPSPPSHQNSHRRQERQEHASSSRVFDDNDNYQGEPIFRYTERKEEEENYEVSRNYLRTNSKIQQTRKHIETLEKIQSAEKKEHEDMREMIRQWHLSLEDDDCTISNNGCSKNDNSDRLRQLNEIKMQEKMLNDLVMEWNVRQEQIIEMKRKLAASSISDDGSKCNRRSNSNLVET